MDRPIDSVENRLHLFVPPIDIQVFIDPPHVVVHDDKNYINLTIAIENKWVESLIHIVSNRELGLYQLGEMLRQSYCQGLREVQAKLSVKPS